MSRQIRDSVVLITGASAGIGRALAVELARRGAKLALAARRLDRLEMLVAELGGNHLCLKADVAVAADCHLIVERTERFFGRLDTLVCNAGYGLVRRVHEMTEAELLTIFQTNVVGTTECLRAAVPYMKRNEICNGYRGQIMIVSSAAARRGLPFFGAYAGTKAFQLSLAEAARVELKADRIAVTSVHPVGTDSDFLSAAESLSNAKIDVPGRRGMHQTAELVARKMADAIERPRAELWPHRMSRYGLSLATLWPTLGDRLMRKSLVEIEERQRSEHR
jgi:short-subunit dehydrogenase